MAFSYKITASLDWNSQTDLDIYAEHSGDVVWYGHPAGTYFTLNHDAYPDCRPYPVSPEVVTSNSDFTAAGRFRFWFNRFANCDEEPYAITKKILVENTGTENIFVNGVRVAAGDSHQINDIVRAEGTGNQNSFSSGTIVKVDSVGVTIYPPEPPDCKCDCCCTDDNESSSRPVRYFNGEIQLSVQDLNSKGLGLSWGHRRTWSNCLSVDADFPNGYNWLVEDWAYVVQLADSSVQIIFSPTVAYSFDLVSGSYVPRYGAKQTLTHVGSYLVLTFPKGEVWKFRDFADPVAPGKLDSGIAASGFVTTVSYNPNGTVNQASRSSGGAVLESYGYSYGTYGANQDRLTSVALLRGGHRPEQVVYTYHDGGDGFGNWGDLRTADHQNWNGTTWVSTGITYYRYYQDAAGGIGYQHGLKYVLRPDGYARMATARLDPLTATDEQVAAYAEMYFEYNNETDRRVSREVVDGNTQVYAFTYTDSSFSDDYNNWKRRTVEARPDGSRIIVYTNYLGQVILRELNDGGSPAKRWIDYWQFDSNGHGTKHYMPSAINMSASPVYDDTHANLAVALNASNGLVHVKTYYTSTDPITGGGTGSGTGAVAGYQQYEQVQHGSSGTPITLKWLQYTTNTAGGITIYPVAKETVYRNDDGSGAITTSYAYTWPSGSNQASQQVTTYPVVSTGQNGPGTAVSRTEQFDSFGNQIWERDPRGFISHQVFDTTLGVVTQAIRDFDTESHTGAPSGWTTPSGGGLHLVTDFSYDLQSRRTQSLGPSHTVDLAGTANSVRTASWTVYRDDLNQVWSAQGYVSGTSPGYTYTLVNPVSISEHDQNGRNIRQIVATRGSSVESTGILLANDRFPTSSWVRISASVYDDQGNLTATQLYLGYGLSWVTLALDDWDALTLDEWVDMELDVDHLDTIYGYDSMDRQNRVLTPGGTITRTVYDVRGLAVSTWIGTNDTGATDSNPAGSGAPNNMLLVQSMQYDDGNAGLDGNLTQNTSPVDATNGNDRVNGYLYDWRNRQTAIDGEVDFCQVNTYDNLDQVTQVDRYDTTSSGNLIGRSQTLFDDQGRIYRTFRYAVDPATGTVGNSLTDNTWYDAAGNNIKQKSAGSSVWMKQSYDGVGRTVWRYVGYSTGTEDYSEAGSISTSIIFSQSQTVYDAAGNTIEMDDYQRFHDAPSTGTGSEGALNLPTGSDPKARVSYVAMYPDGVGRVLNTANYGTNNNASFTRADTAPARSDTVLVSSTAFNIRGEAYQTTDPAGTITEQTLDFAGRRVKLVENETGSTGDDQNRTTTWSYTPDSQVAQMTAVNARTGNQTTSYSFGVTVSGGSTINSNDLLHTVTYPDGGTVTAEYNRQSQRIKTTDQNSTVHQYDYDKLGRLLYDRVTTVGTGIDNAVLRIGVTYEVRGMPTAITSYNNASVGSGSVVNQVTNTYNEFSQLVSQSQEHNGAVIP